MQNTGRMFYKSQNYIKHCCGCLQVETAKRRALYILSLALDGLITFRNWPTYAGRKYSAGFVWSSEKATRTFMDGQVVKRENLKSQNFPYINFV